MRASLNCAMALKEVLTLDTGGMIIHLDLSNNFLGDTGSRIIAKAVKKSLSLVSLDLSSNCILAPAMAYLFRKLKQNYSLTDLRVKTINGINDNNVTNEALNALQEYLEDNYMTSILDLEGTLLHDKGLKIILNILGKVAKEQTEIKEKA